MGITYLCAQKFIWVRRDEFANMENFRITSCVTSGKVTHKKVRQTYWLSWPTKCKQLWTGSMGGGGGGGGHTHKSQWRGALIFSLIKRLSKQSWGWWFETLSRPLWRHGNVLRVHITSDRTEYCCSVGRVNDCTLPKTIPYHANSQLTQVIMAPKMITLFFFFWQPTTY